MAGLDPFAIHAALAAQIRAYISTDVTVYSSPQRNPSLPCVSVWPAADYVAYVGTMGANGQADMAVELVVEVTSIDDESEFRLLSDLLAAGTGHGGSLFDAVHSDRTLGGVVADAFVRDAQWPADPEESLRAVLTVEIIVTKSGAKV